jgi:hypothetical protein
MRQEERGYMQEERGYMPEERGYMPEEHGYKPEERGLCRRNAVYAGGARLYGSNEFGAHYVYHAVRLQRRTGSPCTLLGPIYKMFRNVLD